MQIFTDRVLVRTIPPEEKTKGGIVVPGAKPSHHRSTVVLVGGEVKHVKPGDVVLHYTPGTNFEVKNETLKLLSEGDLIGKE
jgi:co-chaperonin GroES (HSP10)